MKYFMVQIKIDTNGEVTKGTSDYDDMPSAMVAFHLAHASARQKEDTAKFTACILNENGQVMKNEVYEAPVTEEETTAEEAEESVN